jgi:RNA-directed DNA polymerase
VVDVDLEKFFDRVNRDILIDRLQKRIGDAGVVRLIRAYLSSGIMDDGVVQPRTQGTPQKRTALASVGQPAARRGEQGAGASRSLLRALRRRYERLHSQPPGGCTGDGVASAALRRIALDGQRVAVASVFGRKFLGYSFWEAPNGVIKCRGSSATLCLGMEGLLPAGANATGLARARTRGLRHRLRAIQLKQWKRGTTMYRELLALGAKPVPSGRIGITR